MRERSARSQQQQRGRRNKTEVTAADLDGGGDDDVKEEVEDEAGLRRHKGSEFDAGREEDIDSDSSVCFQLRPSSGGSGRSAKNGPGSGDGRSGHVGALSTSRRGPNV